MSVTYYTENKDFVDECLMEWVLSLIQTNDMQKRKEFILLWCLIEEARLKGTSSIVSDLKFKDNSFTLNITLKDNKKNFNIKI